VGLEPNETLRLAILYVNKGTYIITNTRKIPSMDVNIGADEYPQIDEIVANLNKLSETVVAFDATDLAIAAGNPQTMNVVMLGALASSGRLPYESEVLREAVMQRVPPRTRDVNLKAFNLGWEISKDDNRKT
jgi:indolepyruvate ferredoxin oxidoreductase beta subunit